MISPSRLQESCLKLRLNGPVLEMIRIDITFPTVGVGYPGCFGLFTVKTVSLTGSMCSPANTNTGFAIALVASPDHPWRSVGSKGCAHITKTHPSNGSSNVYTCAHVAFPALARQVCCRKNCLLRGLVASPTSKETVPLFHSREGSICRVCRGPDARLWPWLHLRSYRRLP